jgi:hypothetical protein
MSPTTPWKPPRAATCCLAVASLVLACATGIEASAPPATIPATQSAAAAARPHEDGEHDIDLWRLVGPAGAVTLALVIATVATALLRRLKPRPLLKVHKVLGVCALISACVHALLVFLSE